MAAEPDPFLFEMIHTLLQQQPALQTERREKSRATYQCVQLIAPYNGKELPAQSEFFPSQCNDLSPTGFSFQVSEAPKSKQVIVALGRVPFEFFVADIVHVEAKQDDCPFRVGCKFVKRITS